jgi:hypothetical protein
MHAIGYMFLMREMNMEEKRQPTVRAAIEWGRKRLNVLGLMLVGVFMFISRALGIIVGLLVLVSLGSAIGVVAYLTFKHW